MIVGQQTPHGVGDEQQPAARQGGALDQQLLPFLFALIGADQALRCDRLLGATNPRSALVELLAAGVALFDDLPDREYLIARDRLFLIRLRQRLLNLALLASGALHGDLMRDV